MKKAPFTPVAARLIEKGIVKKERSKDDKRVYKLVLTGFGEKFTDNFKNEHWKFMTEVFNKLSAEEQSDYFQHLSALNQYNEKIRREGE